MRAAPGIGSWQMHSRERIAIFVEEETRDLADTGQPRDFANCNPIGRLPRGYALLGLAALGWIVLAGAAPILSAVTGI